MLRPRTLEDVRGTGQDYPHDIVRPTTSLPRPGAPIRVLIVGECPEIDPATERLRRFVRHLHLRSDTEVQSVWLVHGSARRSWRSSCEGVLVLDDLREWAPAVWLDRIGLALVGGKLRGLRWRRQLARIGRVDIALVDQGRGSSIVAQLPQPPARVVVRRSDDEPPPRSDSPGMRDEPALVLVDGGTDVSGDVPSRAFELDLDATTAWLSSLSTHRAATRRLIAHGGDLLVVGTGADGDEMAMRLFQETLESLSAGTELSVRGCWIDASAVGPESGVAVSSPTPEGQDALAAGDVLIAPGTGAVAPSLLLWALACGVPVIGTSSALADGPEDELHRTTEGVSSGDLASLVLAVAPVEDAVRDARMESARLRWDVTGRAAQFVDLANELLDSGTVGVGGRGGGNG